MHADSPDAETSLLSLIAGSGQRKSPTTADTGRWPWLQPWQQRSGNAAAKPPARCDGGGSTKMAAQAASYLATSPAYASLELNEQSARLVERMARDTVTIRAIRQGNWSQLAEQDIDSLIDGLARSFPNGDCTYLAHIEHTGIYMSPEEVHLVALLLRTPVCNVRELTLRNVSLTSAGARVLAKALKDNTRLRRLDLAENALNGAAIRRLCRKLNKVSLLQGLDLARNPIGPRGIAALFPQPDRKLSYFATLNGTGAPKRHRQHQHPHHSSTTTTTKSHGKLARAVPMHSFMPLVQLNVRDTALGPEGMQLLARLVATKRTLRWLNAAGNHGGVAGTEAMAHVLADPTLRLARLSLESNDIGVQGGKAIARALLTNVALTHLHLPRNNLKDEGVEAIARALCSNHTVRYLQLEFNGITQTGARSLGDTLRENNVLRGLQLKFNFVGDDGCRVLADALTANTSLEHISLCNNQLTDACTDYLVQALARNRALQHLSLAQNRALGPEGHRRLAETLLKHNTTLKSIRLDYEFPDWAPIYETVQASAVLRQQRQRQRQQHVIDPLLICQSN
ncbi:hypothetical protein SYNPS1DRAFT_21329 [Syncephalis pseudoplumigaleata]|uniref:Uncharacterized protein n=1 Tax=Syncephalis pseudoplumigaleata TaxID=1712513 RepID=A0A4P9Z4Q4_9FUNG|nr:hypothetical protein SYNPS1DRAFT_21329 [Syncephalis pseudoplumigaleata]|eukprot:RKP27052.1 hypothetical protein SYNPS1DRAFT_21329 [Syncephalis pseudoplumigaleata]